LNDCIFINADSGIEEPRDLVGKRVGLPEYQITAAMFQRGLLQHEYVMGYDFWPYGLEANRPTLEAGTLYSYEQGLTPRKFEIEELFVPSTLHEFEI